MTSNLDLARLLGLVATGLDNEGHRYSGIVRHAARVVLDVPDHRDGGCRGCGARLPTAGRGRPRVWCSETCRRRHRP